MGDVRKDSNLVAKDRRVVCDASFYILPTPLTILIWSGPARAVSRPTGQVLFSLITRSHRDALVKVSPCYQQSNSR